MRGKTNLVRWLLCMLVMLMFSRTAAAGGIIYVDADAVGANNGSSWENAYVFLQDALADAETAEKPVEIRVAQGIYTPGQGFRGIRARYRAHFQLINEVAIKGGFAGFSEADPNARDVELYKTILSGDLEGNDADINNPSDMGGDPTRADNCRNVVVCSNTDATAVLEGLTITGGHSTGFLIEGLAGGAGMIIYSSSPTLINCIFTCNFANQAGGGLRNSGGSPTLINCTFSKNQCGRGGGMINYDKASPTFINCIFHNNTGNSYGAGMYNHNSSPKLINCMFSENATNYGGGIYSVRSNTILHNCVFSKNEAENSGGGIYNYDSSNLILTNCTFFGNSAGQGNALACDSAPSYPSIIEVTNCIFWDNHSEIWYNANSTITINYSNILGGWPGRGNIDTDPLFADTVNNDYHLKSQAGRWDPFSESWVIDDITSPCIDAGDPNTPVAFEPFPNGGIINMGAYGGTTEASMSPSGIHPKYGGGSGTPEDPYLIYTAEQMNAIGANWNDWDKQFKLMADIDLSGYTGMDFNIIGKGLLPAFTGVFDGNGHTISNFTYTSTGETCIGIFGYVYDPNARIINVGMIDPNVNDVTAAGVGSLAGWIDLGTVTNCYVTGGSVTGKQLVGGLIGSSAVITDCYAVGGRVIAEGSAGCLVGRSSGSIIDCYATGNVTGSYRVGGLVGSNRGAIVDSYSEGNVIGGWTVGGLVGHHNEGIVDNCFSTASVTGKNVAGGLVGDNDGYVVNCYCSCTLDAQDQVGGLVGINDGVITASYSSADINGRDEIGGLVGYNTDDAEIINCYANGNVIGRNYVGGLVGNDATVIPRPGLVLSGMIRNCYSVTIVSGDQNVGGLIGYFGEDGVSGSFWDIEVSGQTTSDGGVGKTTLEMQDPNTIIDAGWDFAGAPGGPGDIWTEPEGGGYPVLMWQLSPPPQLPSFSGGSGEPDDPYLVSTADELNSIGHNPRLMTAHFKLVNNIDLTGVDFYIIASQYYPFRGTFDGNDHTISNFSYTSPEATDVGLFGYMVGGQIKKLGLINPNVHVDKGDFHGCLVGLLTAGTITHCYVESGSVTGQNELGGLVGENGYGGIIMNCYFTGNATGSENVGGLVGQNHGSISASYSSADVEGRIAAGGLVGRCAPGDIVNCYARGNVAGQWYVGGLVGSNGSGSRGRTGAIRNCYSASTSLSGAQKGGLLGADWGGEVSDSFWDIETSSQTTSYGGEGKATAEMQTAGTFLDAGWDFAGETANGTEDTWWILEGQDYPRLWWEYAEDGE